MDAIREAGTSLTVHAGPDGDVLYAVVDEQWAIGYATAPDPGLKVPIDSLPLHELGYIVSKGESMSIADINITIADYGLGHQIVSP